MTVGGPAPQAEVQKLIALWNADQFIELIAEGERLVARHPRTIIAYDLLGKANQLLQRSDQALVWFRRAIEAKPDFLDAHFNLGLTLLMLGRPGEAVASFDRAIALKPDLAQAYDQRGVALQALGRVEESIDSHRRAIAIRPNHPPSHFNLASALLARGRHAEAIPPLEHAIALRPDYAEAYGNLGAALQGAGRTDEAISRYRRALEINPNYAEAHNNLGTTLLALGRADEATACFERALRANPGFAQAHFNMGEALARLDRKQEAIPHYCEALRIDPAFAEPYLNLGNILRDLGQAEEAVSAYRQALHLKPGYAEAHNNLASALDALGRVDDAMASYRRALEIRPDYADAHYNLGLLLQKLGRTAEAIECHAEALRIAPDFAEARAQKMLQQAHICDWDGLRAEAGWITSLGITGDAVSPFALLPFDDDPERNRIRSERYAAKVHPLSAPRSEAQRSPARSPRDRPIRIGYFSADFHDHATMHLIAGLFERHDRDRFQTHIFSYGPDSDDASRRRLLASVDEFHPVRDLDDRGIAELARRERIDIAVDLKGFTGGTRLGMFAHGAAPIQISYLGYPGTLGTPFIDYIVADKMVVPDEQRRHIAEHILYLSGSYQVNDDRRPISDRSMTRAEMGLPADAFVFCCFNHSYKISPELFGIWMRLLAQVDGSILWLFRANDQAEANLRKAAQAHGVDAERLIFADHMPSPDHLARHRLADLFLDTFNVNAHTTASDALWAGLPLITRAGKGFVARVAASLLTAIGLPELIVTTSEDYERLALALAHDPDRLKAIRARLASNRLASPLFDTSSFTRRLESGYEQIFEAWCQGRPFSDIEVGV